MKVFLRDQCDEQRQAIIEQHINTDWELITNDEPDDDAVIAGKLREADAVLAMHWRTSDLPAPRLKLIQLPGAGLDGIDWTAVPAGCAVCNVYEHEIGISEFIVLGLLEWEINLRRSDTKLRQGIWTNTWAIDGALHGELFGKTVGFLGYGRIAKESAKRLRPFGVRIVARTRSPHSGDEFVDEIGTIDDIDTMYSTVDYLVVSCPLTDATRGLVDNGALSKMKNDSVIVNVGRGPIIDEAALFEACRNRDIGGAIIDTWYQYPTTPSDITYPSVYPFHELDNVILSPHGSGWSAGLFERRYRRIAENLNRLARGEPLVNLASRNS